ncbi:metallophosphoesterase [Polaromonas sp. P1(28)-13]|nr:metallophosphoesterase [Polaromonas sp. P1(28)-13]
MSIPADVKSFLDVYNNLVEYPTMNSVAEKLGVAIKTVRNKAGFLRNLAKGDPSATQVILRASTSETPMSEDLDKITDDWTKEQCVAELRRVAEMDEDRVVTRNYFRITGSIAESVWSRHYGTFEEFKRQASLKLTRQQHGLERAIAKHASVDHYRQLTIDRADYGDKYLVTKDTRFKTILICSDLHDIEIDEFYLRVLIDTAKRVNPDVIVFNGDVFDLPEFGKYGVDPREWNVVGRIKFVHERIFKPLREALPDVQFDLIEGNHEARLLRHLADQTPALRAVLSDLHGMTISQLLGLDEYRVNYIAKADLAAFTKQDFNKQLAANYKIYFESFMCHHFPHARKMGLPGVNGHHHSHEVWPCFNPIYGAYEWHQLGSGHKRSATYCEGERWHNGFDIAHIDTKTRSTVHDYVTVTDFAVAGGKFYYRELKEYDMVVLKPLLLH